MAKKQHITQTFLGDSLNIFAIRSLNTIAALGVMIYCSHFVQGNVYGEYQNFWINLNIMAAVGGLGLHVLALTYPSNMLLQLIRNIRKRWCFAYFAFVIAVAIGFAALCSSLFQSLPIDITTFGLFFILYIASQLFESLLIVLKRYRALLLGNFLYTATYILLAILILGHGDSVAILIRLLAPLLLLKAAFYFGLLRKQFRTELPGTYAANYSSTRILWMQLAFYDLIAIFFTWIDKFILAFFLNPVELASYSNATVNIPFIGVALSAVGSAALIRLGNSYGIEQKAAVMRESGRLLSCIAFPLFFWLLAFRGEFITVVFSERYLNIINIFTAAILVLPVRAYNNTALLQHMHKGKIINAGAILDLGIALALMYPMYLLAGLAGVALSFVISTYIHVLFYLFFASKFLNLPPWRLVPFANWMWKFIVFGILAFLWKWLLKDLIPAFTLLASGGFILSIVALPILIKEQKKSQRVDTQ